MVCSPDLISGIRSRFVSRHSIAPRLLFFLSRWINRLLHLLLPEDALDFTSHLHLYM